MKTGEAMQERSRKSGEKRQYETKYVREIRLSAESSSEPLVCVHIRMNKMRLKSEF